MSKPTALERAVLQAFAEPLDSLQREHLTEQIASASVSRRENTGAGFFTYFHVGDDLRSSLPDLKDREVAAEVAGLQHGMGFILWIKDGRIDCLEGYSYEEATTPIVWETVEFELVDLKKKYLS